MSLAKPFNTRPLYQQVADEFVSRIVTRVWAPGQAIENETEIARSLGISLGTVRKAFDILSDHKLLERHQGKGTVVVDFDDPRMRARFSNIRDRTGARVSGEVTISDVRITTIESENADRLEVNARTPVLSFRRVRNHERRIFMVEDVFLRVDANAHRLSPEALREVAHRRWSGQDIATRHRERVSAEVPGDADRVVFDLIEGDAILKLVRVISSYQDRPLELRIGRCHLGAELQYGCS